MRRGLLTLAAVLVLVAGACGGEDGPGDDRATWLDRNGTSLQAFRLDVDAANSALNAGDRTVILAACNSLATSAEELESKALPVPDGDVDALMRTALADAAAAARSCVTAARDTSAELVEASMEDMEQARLSLSELEAGIESWT